VRLRKVSVTAETRATPEAVYALLADGATWPLWSPIESFELEQAGEASPEGVGAIRVLRRGRTTGRDQIVELIPNRGITYATLSGVPVRNYIGVVDLDRSTGGSTTIHWHSTFYPARPGSGWLVERGIRRFLQRCVQGLAEYSASSIDTNAST
jgi:hypothetical protein